ncbi:hypothetical protein N0V85_008720 [Neurospora sp. IMI 360204]|nr:hypothetical protein N0V85_008720 [Neurospora sp. IMI 360204]
MNHQNNQKPAFTRVIDMLDDTVKEGLYRVEPELKNPRKFLESTQEAQQVALKTLYEDSGVRTPISQGAMEWHITTAPWKKYFPHGQGSPTEPLRAFCEELCPKPDRRWARYLEQRLKEEEDRNPRSEKRQLEESAKTSKPSPSHTTKNKETGTTETLPPPPARKTVRFHLSRGDEDTGEGSSRGSKQVPIDSNTKAKGTRTAIATPASTTHTTPPKPAISQLRSPTLYQDILTAKCLEEKMGVRWFPLDDSSTVKGVLIGDVYVAASATSMTNHTMTEVKEELARRILDTCSEMRLYCISRQFNLDHELTTMALFGGVLVILVLAGLLGKEGRSLLEDTSNLDSVFLGEIVVGRAAFLELVLECARSWLDFTGDVR